MWLTRNDLPRSISIGNNRYSVKTDFRDWIKFECILTDEEILDRFKPILLFKAVMYEVPKKQQEQILNALFSFYRLDKQTLKSNKKSSEIAYQFDYDMDLIMAAFYQQYNINLLIIDLHWWEFKALFDGLTEDTKFIKVVGYRTADTSKMSKEQKAHYAKLKKFYALPKNQSSLDRQEELEAGILKQIKGGGDHGK